MHATVDAEGRIALGPELGLEPGDEVFLERRGNEWILKIAKMPLGLTRDGRLVHRGVCTEPIDDIVAKDREKRMDQLSEGIPR